MARYTDIDQLIDKIEGTDWYHISKLGELTKGANSKYDIPLYKHSDIEEVLNNAPIIEDVVPRSEVEDLKCQLEREREYIEFLKANIVSGKQEVARDILGELSSHTSIGIRHLKELMAECDNEENKIWLEGKISELCNVEKIISEYEKKYIGERNEQQTNR